MNLPKTMLLSLLLTSVVAQAQVVKPKKGRIKRPKKSVVEQPKKCMPKKDTLNPVRYYKYCPGCGKG